MRREAKNEKYARAEQREREGGDLKWERKMNEEEGRHVREKRWREKKREEDEEKSK